MSLADIEAVILRVVRDLTGADPASDQPLAAQGLDSLAAMELRQKLQVLCMPAVFSPRAKRPEWHCMLPHQGSWGNPEVHSLTEGTSSNCGTTLAFALPWCPNTEERLWLLRGLHGGASAQSRAACCSAAAHVHLVNSIVKIPRV